MAKVITAVIKDTDNIGLNTVPFIAIIGGKRSNRVKIERKADNGAVTIVIQTPAADGLALSTLDALARRVEPQRTIRVLSNVKGHLHIRTYSAS